MGSSPSAPKTNKNSKTGNQICKPISSLSNEHNKIKKEEEIKSILDLLTTASDITCSSDEFIINYVQNNKIRLNDIKLLDQRRVVFISLIGLYNTWKSCGLIALYSSIFILPLKRAWVFSPKHYIQEIQSHFISNLPIFTDNAETEQFIELIKWKDKQGLVFWVNNDYKGVRYDDYDPLLHPFWINLNSRLTNLYDPITRKKYKPINLDTKHWENKTEYMSKYGSIKTPQIIEELFLISMKFKSITTILDESNPKSFLIITSYNKDGFIEYNNNKIDDIYDEFDTKKENIDDWWVSPDYDPFDLNDTNETLAEETKNDIHQIFNQEKDNIKSIFNNSEVNESYSNDPNNTIVRYAGHGHSSNNTHQNINNTSNNNQENINSSIDDSNNSNNNSNNGRNNNHKNGNGDDGDGDDDKNYKDLLDEAQCYCTNPRCLKLRESLESEIIYLREQVMLQQQIIESAQRDQAQLLTVCQMTSGLDKKCDDIQNNKQRKNKKKNKKKKIKSEQKQTLLHTETIDQSDYDPLSSGKIFKNITVPKRLIQSTIPSTIPEVCGINTFTIAKAMTMQFMDRPKQFDKDKIAIDLGFYDEKQQNRMYPIVDKEFIDTNNIRWKMRDGLFTAKQIKEEFIDQISIPKPWTQKLNLSDSMQTQIDKIDWFNVNWGNIPVFKKTHNKRRTILCAVTGHFGTLIRKKYKSNTLIPIVMFNNAFNTKGYWIEWVSIVQIDENICVGISFKYNENDSSTPWKISGLHLDKGLLLEQHHLVSPHHLYACQCDSFDSWNSCITDIEITDDLNAQSNAVQEIKDKYQSLKSFVYRFIEDETNGDYAKMKSYGRFLIGRHDGSKPQSPSINSSISNSPSNMSSNMLLGYNSSTVSSSIGGYN